MTAIIQSTDTAAELAEPTTESTEPAESVENVEPAAETEVPVITTLAEPAAPRMCPQCSVVVLQRSRERITESVVCAVSWVATVLRRYRTEGIDAFADRRADNGDRKIDQQLLVTLGEVLDQSSEAFHFPRPTWTRELLVKC